MCLLPQCCLWLCCVMLGSAEATALESMTGYCLVLVVQGLAGLGAVPTERWLQEVEAEWQQDMAAYGVSPAGWHGVSCRQ